MQMPNKKLTFESPWCDSYTQEKFVPQGNPNKRNKITLKNNETLTSILERDDYTIPGVVCFYLE